MPRHFQQAEAGNTTHLHPGPIRFQCVAHAVLNLALITVGTHIDKIDDDQAAHVPQSQLPGDLIGRLEVGSERRFFDIGTAGGA